MSATLLLRWVGWGAVFLLLGFVVGLKGWANTLDPVPSEPSRSPGILEPPRLAGPEDPAPTTSEEAAAIIAAPVYPSDQI